MRNRIARSVVLLSLILLASCMAAPAKIADVQLQKPATLALPINGIVVIDMTAQEREDVYTYARSPLPWDRFTYPKGKLLESAALKAFGLVYTQTATSLTMAGLSQTSASANPMLPQFRLIARVSSQSIQDSVGGPVSAVYRVRTSASFFKPDGSFVGTFTGNGSGEAFNVKDHVPIENAYFNAFVDIINQMMRDSMVVARL